MIERSTFGRKSAAVLTLIAGAVFSGPERLGAQESAPSPGEADRALERLQDALSREPGLSKETRDALMEVVRTLRARGSQAMAQPLEPAIQDAIRRIAELEKTAPKGPSPLTFYGDVRLRHETSWRLDDQPSRNRGRVRLRAGAEYALTDSLKAGARVTTGARNDARSPHQTLGDSFNRFEINLDRAYVAWRPECVPGGWLTAGKFANPFYANPGYGELVWDADVQPEGIAAGWSRDGLGPFEKFQITAGEYVLIEQALGSEASAFAAQASATAKLRDDWKGTLAAGLYRYTDLTPGDSQAVVSHNAGNATVGIAPTLEFVSRFTVLNPIAAVSYGGLPKPLTVSGEWIKNTRAAVNGDAGYALGASYGATQKAGDCRFYYQWQVVEQDAVLSPFSQDDFLFGTNHRSHLVGMNYQILDRVGVHLWGLFSARDRTQPGTTTDSDRTQCRARLDLNIRF